MKKVLILIGLWLSLSSSILAQVSLNVITEMQAIEIAKQTVIETGDYIGEWSEWEISTIYRNDGVGDQTWDVYFSPTPENPLYGRYGCDFSVEMTGDGQKVKIIPGL